MFTSETFTGKFGNAYMFFFEAGSQTRNSSKQHARNYYRCHTRDGTTHINEQTNPIVNESTLTMIFLKNEQERAQLQLL